MVNDRQPTRENVWETPQVNDIVRIKPESFSFDEIRGLERADEKFHRDSEQLYVVLAVIPASSDGEQRRALKIQKVKVKKKEKGEEVFTLGESMGNVTPAIEHFVLVKRWDGRSILGK